MPISTNDAVAWYIARLTANLALASTGDFEGFNRANESVWNALDREPDEVRQAVDVSLAKAFTSLRGIVA